MRKCSGLKLRIYILVKNLDINFLSIKFSHLDEIRIIFGNIIMGGNDTGVIDSFSHYKVGPTLLLNTKEEMIEATPSFFMDNLNL